MNLFIICILSSKLELEMTRKKPAKNFFVRKINLKIYTVQINISYFSLRAKFDAISFILQSKH